jgi:hypothetical protein
MAAAHRRRGRRYRASPYLYDVAAFPESLPRAEDDARCRLKEICRGLTFTDLIEDTRYWSAIQEANHETLSDVTCIPQTMQKVLAALIGIRKYQTLNINDQNHLLLLCLNLSARYTVVCQMFLAQTPGVRDKHKRNRCSFSSAYHLSLMCDILENVMPMHSRTELHQTLLHRIGRALTARQNRRKGSSTDACGSANEAVALPTPLPVEHALDGLDFSSFVSSFHATQTYTQPQPQPLGRQLTWGVFRSPR